jgi:RNA polymerase sporulation-specific sigma factor
LSAIKAASRNKHAPLNNRVPLESPCFDESDPRAACIARNALHRDPEELVIAREGAEEILEALSGRLSGFEFNVLELYLSGLSYTEIAVRISKPVKSVDNAVQRFRRKLAQHHYHGDIRKT